MQLCLTGNRIFRVFLAEETVYSLCSFAVFISDCNVSQTCSNKPFPIAVWSQIHLRLLLFGCISQWTCYSRIERVGVELCVVFFPREVHSPRG